MKERDNQVRIRGTKKNFFRDLEEKIIEMTKVQLESE